MGYRGRMMTMTTKTTIFREHLDKYLAGTKQQRGAILDHVCFVAQVHRKAASRKFHALGRRSKTHRDRRGRPTVYGPDVTATLRTVWDAGNEVCGELLFPMLREYVDILQRDGMWEHREDTTTKLLAMSLATVKRRVSVFLKARTPRSGISSTKPSHLKHIIPVFTGPWADEPPGSGQLDTVRHSDSATGDAVYTLNYTDAATLTVIPRAQWNKGQEATQRSLMAIAQRLPFPFVAGHPDSGSEFLNWLVKAWADANGIHLTRSRPNHKNDNMYVEERNGHVVRKFLGYLPLTTPRVVPALNALYDVLTPYLLHFVAVRRQTSKKRVGSQYRRTYEQNPKTPYQRILDHPAVSEDVKAKLRAEHATLNPLILKREIDRRVEVVYRTERRYGTHSSS